MSAWVIETLTPTHHLIKRSKDDTMSVAVTWTAEDACLLVQAFEMRALLAEVRDVLDETKATGKTPVDLDVLANRCRLLVAKARDP